MHSVDFLIIGQGLAGSLLAYSLIKQGAAVMVIDDHHRHSATQVAAGLINPITGHRLNITDRFFEYAIAAKKMYWQIERDLGCEVYREIAQTRLIKNPGQAEYLKKRLQQSEYQPLLNNADQTGGWFDDQERFPYGAISVAQTAIIDTKVLLHAMRAWLDERASLISEKVDYKQIKANNHRVEYQNVSSKKLVFCEGFQAKDNPWLASLPFKLSKGEVLTVQANPNNRAPTRMLSWGKWLVPINNRRYKLGSNYLWNDTNLQINPDTADQFRTELREHTQIQSKLLAHEVGIRPSTTQRIPFVGPLSNLKHAYCLNGLGSKGCLIAPHHVNALTAHMLIGQNLDEELTKWL